LARVFVTRHLPGPALDRLRQVHEVEVWAERRPPTYEELKACVSQVEGLIALPSDPIDAALIASAPELRAIANYAVGYDNIDLDAAQARGIAVGNTPDVLTDATADLAWALILACARRVVEGTELIKSGAWTGWHPELLLGTELRGRTLGLLGAGRIGQAVGRRAVAFGMRILYAARNARPEFEQATGAMRVEQSRLFRESDVLSLHVPSAPATRGLISAETLRLMKPGAILINTARGDLVREEALAAALEDGRLGAAGLDVYLDEPAVHPRLRAAPRTVLLPHIGSATRETRRQMAAIAVANVQAVLRGDPPLTPVVG
jgi:glyoxylate reductase